MKNYYALCCWVGKYKGVKVLFKLKKERHDRIKKIQEALFTDNTVNIFPFIDSVLISNKKIIYSKHDWFWEDEILENDEQIRNSSGDQRKAAALFLLKSYGDKILEFDSDDDAKLWFEVEYNL